MKRILINAAIFQAGWIACVVSAANQSPWIALIVVAGAVAWHLREAPYPSSEIYLMLFAAALGTIWDSILVSASLLVYPSGMFMTGIAPYWIIAMWLLFATTLNVSLRWLKRRWLLATVVGAVSGPASYYAGFKLGGVTFTDMPVALAMLGAGWAVILPLLACVSDIWDGFRSPASLPSGAVTG